jgi:hypothetical protein
MERQMEASDDGSYVAWPARFIYEASDAVYIPIQAIPGTYPLSGLVEPPPPFGPDKTPVSDALAIRRSPDGIRIEGARLAELAQLAIGGERQQEEAYWHDLSRCTEQPYELIVKSSTAGGTSKIFLCDGRIAVYAEGKKRTCVVSPELFHKHKLEQAEVGLDVRNGTSILLYMPGDSAAQLLNCDDGDQKRLSIEGTEGAPGVAQIVQVAQLFKVQEAGWFMAATARTSDSDQLSYVLYSIDSRKSMIVGALAGSKIYVSEKNGLLLHVENNTLTELSGHQSWQIKAIDLKQPLSSKSAEVKWVVAFGRSNQKRDGFEYSLSENGTIDTVGPFNADYFAPLQVTEPKM